MISNLILFPGLTPADEGELRRGQLLTYSDMANPQKEFVVTGERRMVGGEIAIGRTLRTCRELFLRKGLYFVNTRVQQAWDGKENEPQSALLSD